MTTDTKAVAAAPDLSPLLNQGEEGKALYTRIVLAMIGGATWVGDCPDYRRAWKTVGLCDASGNLLCWMTEGVLNETPRLPDPLNDPAAAWNLMVEQRISVAPAYSTEFPGDDPWTASFGFRDGRDVDARMAAGARRALVTAVLHKYVDDPRFSALIRPLLTMENQR